jgi:glycosyltransferase involved in cell wall biosynthesis
VKETSRPLRVAHVVGQMRVGGMEKLLIEFARHADRATVEPLFVSLGARGPICHELESLGCNVITLHRGEGFRPSALLRLAAIFRGLHVDVVHTHNLRPLIYGAPAARLARARAVVHTRHGQQFGATRAEILRLRWASRLVDWMICVSEDSRRLAASTGIAWEKLRVVHNGIDVEHFQYSGPCAGGPIVSVGRLSPEKGVDQLLRAMAIVSKEDASLRLEIAGDGPSRGALGSLVEELNLTGQVSFLGEVDDVASLLQRAAVFVLPSLTEGISLTLLEAMSQGLPVVATRVGGSPEVVVHGETGLLVDPASPEQLASAILRLHRESGRARVMGLAARERVTQDFDARRMVREYQAIYFQCVEASTDAARKRAG